MPDHVRLATAITGLLVAGCAADTPSSSTPGPAGGASAGTSASGSAAPRPDAAGRPARCHTSQLAGRVRMLDAAAGNRYAALILTNTSSAPCRTFGYVGLQLIGAAGTKLPTVVIRESRPGPRSITLGPGASAWTRIHWTVASGAGEPAAEPCRPRPAPAARHPAR
ncbi:MAG TPA: DUF4232 domain-containing protein [Streptosporangiaceae bacterium]|nr:DUF4232 domain-containing protein [Streptosporangiaceae bacterium]